jgi:hypothetical protein
VVRLYPTLALLALLVGCTGASPDPVLSDEVHVVLYTSQCEPEEPLHDRFYVTRSGTFDISWEALCVRDDREISWWAVKVSYWEDRAEDAWNVWLIDPDVDRVRYGEAMIPGASDPNLLNEAYPDALERVAPDELVAGEYRVEIWGVVDDYLDSQRNEVRLTVVDQ